MKWLVVGLQTLKCSVRRKIAIAFAIVLAGFFINALISISLLFSIKNAENREREITAYLQRAEYYQQAYQSELNLYFNTIFINKASYVQDDFMTSISNSLGEALGMSESQASRDFESKFTDVYNPAYNDFSDLQSSINAGDIVTAQSNFSKYAPELNAVSDFLKQTQTQFKLEQSTAQQNIDTNVFWSIVIIVILFFVDTILVFLVLFLVGRVLVEPLKKLQTGLRNVSEGDLDGHIAVINQDEVGELAHNFQMAMLSIGKMLNGVRISENLQAVTNQLTTVSKQQSSGANDQVAALTQVLAAMQELGRTAGRIADSAGEVAKLALVNFDQIEQVVIASQINQESTNQMVVVVETTLQGVAQVGEQVTEFSRVMGELNVQSNEISSIVTLLASIANDIHLLSLNAAIEAAGAGEYGERFKVVAREVKRLAGRASEATQQVASTINRIQVSNRTASTQIEAGQLQVLQIVQTNNELRQSLKNLEQSTQEVGQKVAYLLKFANQVQQLAEEIKSATQQQQNANEQVLGSVQLVGVVAEQVATTTQQIASSSLEIELLGNQLTEVLSQVKIAQYANAN